MEKPHNIYDLRFEQRIASGLSITDSAIAVTDAYLDGKPSRKGKKSFKSADRNAAFWTCNFLESLLPDVYSAESLVLALTRYFAQEQATNFKLIRHIAQVAPEVVRRAVRYSGLVLRQHSERWKEIEQLAITEAAEFNEFIRICHTFDRAHCERLGEVNTYKSLLSELTPLELLNYASLYAFEHLVPREFLQEGKNADIDNNTQEIFYAINDILRWKLQTSTDEGFQLTGENRQVSALSFVTLFISFTRTPKAKRGYLP